VPLGTKSYTRRQEERTGVGAEAMERRTRCGCHSVDRMSTSLQKDLVMVAATEGNEGDDYGGTWRRLTVAGGPAGGGWAEQAGRPAGASVGGGQSGEDKGGGGR
jgi:hypothetical protein